MASTDSNLTGDHKSHPKNLRKPLQPKNSDANPAGILLKPKLIEISSIGEWNKENHSIECINKVNRPILPVAAIDASLAEELGALRRKSERLRLDKEKTERVLRERDLLLEKQLKEMERGEMERKLLDVEIEKLCRLKELQSSCMKGSPIQSLRARVQEKRMRERALEATDPTGKVMGECSGEASSSNHRTISTGTPLMC